MKLFRIRRLALLVAAASLILLTTDVSARATATSSTLVKLSARSNVVAFGHNVHLKAIVKPSAGLGLPTGSVTFHEGTQVLGAGTLVLSGGVETAKLLVANLSVGTHSITANYGGNATYAASVSSTLLITVSRASTTTTVLAFPKTTPGTYKINASVRVLLRNGAIAAGLVTFLVDKLPPQVVALNAFGKAPLTLLLVPGSVHVISATYGGSSLLNGSAGSLTFTA